MLLYHIPVCPFSQRVQILLELKGASDRVRHQVVDITRPRDPELLALKRGTTALPVLATGDGIIKESLVILRYLEDLIPDPPVARRDPFERAVENMLIAMEGVFTSAGYRLLLNQDRGKRGERVEALDAAYRDIDDFLAWQNPGGTWLFDGFGLAETVFSPMFVRFQFLDYYEEYDIPEGLDRVRAWRAACLSHPSTQQVTEEEVVKLYYDYARGKGNGALPEGRRVSSFAFEPHWSTRPWPPRDKYGTGTSDAALGLEA